MKKQMNEFGTEINPADSISRKKANMIRRAVEQNYFYTTEKSHHADVLVEEGFLTYVGDMSPVIYPSYIYEPTRKERSLYTKTYGDEQ